MENVSCRSEITLDMTEHGRNKAAVNNRLNASNNMTQSSHLRRSDATRHQIKIQPHKQDDPTGYAETLSLSITSTSPSFCLYCSAPLAELACCRMDGCRGEGGRSGEVNEIPMRCQGVLAVRRGE